MISVRSYAKHRGVSPAAVSKAIKAGRLSDSIVRDKLNHPKIKTLEEADAEWARNTQERSGTPAKPAAKPEPKLPPGVPSYAESRARNEAAKSGMLTLQLLEAKGKLVNVKGVRDAVSMKFSEIRTKLLGIPYRMRQRSQHITEKDADLLEELIREALETLADDLPTD